MGPFSCYLNKNANIFRHAGTAQCKYQNPENTPSQRVPPPKMKAVRASIILPYIYNLYLSGNICLSNHRFQLCLGIEGQ